VLEHLAELRTKDFVLCLDLTDAAKRDVELRSGIFAEGAS